MWWHEPDILYQETIESSSEPDLLNDEEYLQEFKKTQRKTALTNDTRIDSLFGATYNFSNLMRIQKLQNSKKFIIRSVEVRKLEEDLTSLLKECIEWKSLPPRAPNFGGLWEARVKSFKHHFKKVEGNSELTYEEFLALTCQIKGILHSRRLTSSSEDIDGTTYSGHFFVGRAIAISEPILVDVPENRFRLWQKYKNG
ncbi:uncharacterized protein TNCV_3044731 [Trichonephila clavipes]|nr:uncharacterized protein TNCV_3044731 [Trichonephila clavipes]